MSITAQLTLPLENSSLFRTSASAFNQVSQRELTIPQATTAVGLQSISGQKSSSCRCCRSPIESRIYVYVRTICSRNNVVKWLALHTRQSYTFLLSIRQFFPHQGYAFPVYPPCPDLKIHCANELWDYKQDNNHGAWSNLRALVLRGRDSWGNHRLWVPACALQNQSLTEKCHGEPAGPSYTTRKLSIVLP